ncbi:anti-sigma factor [Chryseobacterium sp. CT-SW4]|uniref:anti-sigma factor n=1 Tax=Chryseobacterium sp. SW-1 TaxID=3157343 RepID=UPI003B027347
MNTKEYISSGIIESYVLGHASPEEAGILECVIKNNAEVREAFEEAQKTLETLATAQSVSPPGDLKSKIWNKIREEQVTEEERPSVSSSSPLIKSRKEEAEIKKNTHWKTLGIAASVLFLASIAGTFFLVNKQSGIQKEIARMKTEKQSQDLAMQKMTQKLTMFSNPDIQRVLLKGVENHQDANAIVFWNKKSKEVYLNAENLPKAPEGMQYQLWAIQDGKPVSAGMYSEDKDSSAVLATIPKAQAFAITLEKEGGSVSPTMENMFVLGEI